MPTENPRELVENALAELRVAVDVGYASPAWMVFRSEMFKAFRIVEERLGGCLRAQSEAVRLIEQQRRELAAMSGKMKEVQEELTVANVRFVNQKLGEPIVR